MKCWNTDNELQIKASLWNNIIERKQFQTIWIVFCVFLMLVTFEVHPFAVYYRKINNLTFFRCSPFHTSCVSILTRESGPWLFISTNRLACFDPVWVSNSKTNTVYFWKTFFNRIIRPSLAMCDCINMALT